MAVPVQQSSLWQFNSNLIYSSICNFCKSEIIIHKTHFLVGPLSSRVKIFGKIVSPPSSKPTLLNNIAGIVFLKVTHHLSRYLVSWKISLKTGHTTLNLPRNRRKIKMCKLREQTARYLPSEQVIDDKLGKYDYFS